MPWKYEERSGKRTKVPYNAMTGGHAQSNNPQTFADFQLVADKYVIGGFNGGGIGAFNGFGAIDVDHCIDETARFPK